MRDTGEWRSVGPDGGGATRLAFDPIAGGTIYAGTIANGLFRTTNYGRRWNAINDGIVARVSGSRLYVQALAPDPNVRGRVFACVDGMVYVTLDGGQRWKLIGADLPEERSPRSLAIDPAVRDTVYCGTGAGVYKSTDAGETWAELGRHPFSYVEEMAVASAPARALFAATYNGLFVNPGGRGVWRRLVPAQLSLAAEAVHIAAGGPDSDVLYAVFSTWDQGSAAADLLKTLDGGETWLDATGNLNLGPPTDVWSIAVNPRDGFRVYLAARSGVFMTSDGGASWVRIGGGLPREGAGAVAISPTEPSVVCAGVGYETYLSTDSGRNWEPAFRGLRALYVASVAVSPPNPRRMYAGTEEGVFRSDDGGVRWRLMGLESGWDKVVCPDPWAVGTIYATDVARLFKSADGGVTWKKCLDASFGDTFAGVVVDPGRRDTVYAMSSETVASHSTHRFSIGPALPIRPPASDRFETGLVKSVDGGKTWRGVIGDEDVYCLAFDPRRPNVLWAAGDTVWRSDDAGESWEPVSVEPMPGSIVDIAIDPTNPETIYLGSGWWGPIRSTDGGESWVILPTPWKNGRLTSLIIDPDEPRTLYAGTLYDGVFRSTDGGLSWEAFSKDLGLTDISTLVVPRDGSRRLFAGTQAAGLWMRRLDRVAQ